MSSWVVGKASMTLKEVLSNLAMEDITDSEYKHAKRVQQDFKI